LMAAFGAAALLLAVSGIYAVITYAVSQRAREIGIRVALGARRVHVATLVMGAGAGFVGLGLIAGMALALAGVRVISTLLFGLDPTDPATFAQVLGVVAGAALLACAVPIVKAGRPRVGEW